MSTTWTYNEASGTWRLELPSVGLLGLVQRSRWDWQATLFRSGARQESSLFTWLSEAKSYVEDWMEERLKTALAELPQKEKYRK